MKLSPNPTSMTNMTFCFLATDVEKIDEQRLDATEELTMHLLSKGEVKDLLERNEIIQSLMVAPLLKYFMQEK